MTTVQFAILAGLVLWISLPTMWLALRLCAAAESIARTLEIAHEAELALGKDAIAARQQAMARARGRSMWVDEDGQIAEKTETPRRFGHGVRA